MLVSLILAVNIGSNFIINLTSNHANIQNYFLLKGSTSGAELIRNNNIIDLYYYNSTKSAHYRIEVNASSIAFKWPCFINSRQMRLVSGVNISENEEFHTFAVADSQTDIEKVTQIPDPSETQNYYVIGASVVLLLLIEFPAAYFHYISGKRNHSTVSQFIDSS